MSWCVTAVKWAVCSRRGCRVMIVANRVVWCWVDSRFAGGGGRGASRRGVRQGVLRDRVQQPSAPLPQHTMWQWSGNAHHAWAVHEHGHEHGHDVALNLVMVMPALHEAQSLDHQQHQTPQKFLPFKWQWRMHTVTHWSDGTPKDG